MILEILKDANISIFDLKEKIIKHLQELPSVSGQNLNIFFSNELIKIIEECKNSKKEFNDEFISPEVILYTIFSYETKSIQNILASIEINSDKIKKSILKVRNGKTVNTANTNIENSLKKFSVDVTNLAKTGKLDPVIGREEEKEKYSSSI